MCIVYDGLWMTYKIVVSFYLSTVCLKKMSFCGKTAITTFKLIQMQKFAVLWKIQDICYNMGTDIFKIEEEMTEKMKPKVANPPQKMGRILCSHYSFTDPLSNSLGHYGP